MKNRFAGFGFAAVCVFAILPSRGWSDTAKATPTTETAERIIVLDLALGKGSRTFDVDPGSTTVRFLNRAPGGVYEFNSRTERLLLEPLEQIGSDAAIETQGLAMKLRLKLVVDPCKKLELALSGLVSPSLEETAVAEAQAVVESLLSDPVIGSCTQAASARAAVARTTKDVPVVLKDGQEVTMILSRVLPKVKQTDAASGKAWTVELSTIGPGRWLTTFGYSFGGFTWDKDERFFANTKGDAFEVAQEAQRGDLAYVPTVFFTWISRGQLRKNLAVGPAAGLGFDSATPTPMLGVAATWRQNVSLVAGALIRKVTRLSGAYTVGQSLTDTATSESLQQSVYRPGLFVSVAFRFGSNPFRGADGADKASEAGKTDAAQTEHAAKDPKKDGQ